MTVDFAAYGGSATTLPTVDGLPRSAGPRRTLRAVRQSDVLAVGGAMASATGLTWLVFTQLAPFSGLLGAIVFWYLAFVAVYGVLVAMDEDRIAVTDRIASVVVHSLAGLLLAALLFVLGYVLVRGAKALVHVNFFTSDLATTGPLNPLSDGGVLHGIVGTLEQITISLVITIPLGLTCAVYLNEFRGAVPRFVRTIVEAMTALPSIVAGLFIFSLWILTLRNDKSGFAAALALSIMMLPIIIRAADVVLRLVPGSLKEASLALGAGQWRTIWHVTLPTARSGLATAVILGTARGIGETSPVLLTAGYAQAVNLNPTSGPQVSLPLLAFSLFNSPSDAMRARAFGSAAVLLVLVLGLFVSARVLGGRGPGNLTKRQAAKRAEQSKQDAERYIARMSGEPTLLAPFFRGVSAAGRAGSTPVPTTALMTLDDPASGWAGPAAGDPGDDPASGWGAAPDEPAPAPGPDAVPHGFDDPQQADAPAALDPDSPQEQDS